MSEAQLSTAATIGQINEMINRAQERIDTARNISHRIDSLRMRLLGGGADVVEGANPASPPEPVRPEVDGLSHNLNILGDILNEIETELSALEGL